MAPPPGTSSSTVHNHPPYPQSPNTLLINEFLILSPETEPPTMLDEHTFPTSRKGDAGNLHNEGLSKTSSCQHLHERKYVVQTVSGVEHLAAAEQSGGNDSYEEHDYDFKTGEVKPIHLSQISHGSCNSVPNGQVHTQHGSQVRRRDSIQQPTSTIHILPTNQEALVQELRIQNTDQQALITELKVRVAVLENDLKHAKKGKEDAVNASAIVAQTLGLAFSSNAGASSRAIEDKGRKSVDSEKNIRVKCRILELEKVRLMARLQARGDECKSVESERKKILARCKILDLEKQVLMAELKNRAYESWDNVDRAYSTDTMSGGDSTEHDESLEQGRRKERKELNHTSQDFVSVDRNDIGKGKGRETVFRITESMIDEDFGLSKQAAVTLGRNRAAEGGLRRAYEKDKAAAAAVNNLTAAGPSRTDKKAVDFRGGGKRWGNSSDTDITTVPYSPTLAVDSRLHSQSEISSQYGRRVDDIGLESLDDVLNCSMNGLPIIPAPEAASSASPHKNQGFFNANEEVEVLVPLETQTIAHMATTANIGGFASPSVLKTGFSMEGSFRGNDYDYEYNNPNPILSTHVGGMSNCSSFNTQSAMTNPLQGLWSSREEREGAIEVHQQATGRGDMKFPNIFRYGIQFVPSESDTNFLRTVHMGNLPHDVELRDVLARVRGGQIISATLLHTVTLTGGMSALVVFITEGDAADYVEYASSRPIIFEGGGEEWKADITLITTPTYPISPRLKSRLYTVPQNTRCLSLPHFPKDFSLRALQRNLGHGSRLRVEHLVEIWLDEDHTLHLEFSSIFAAGFAFGILANWPMYRGLEVYYTPDPCLGPLHELDFPILPRRPMFPCNRASSSIEEYGWDQASGPDPWMGASLNSPHARTERVGGDVITEQRKQFAALSNQVVKIPSFRGSGINSSSWADEVIEEAESSGNGHSSNGHIEPIPNYDTSILSDEPHYVVPPNSPTHGQISDNGKSCLLEALMTENINSFMKQNLPILKEEGRKPPVGLAGSKYASLVPAFEDRDLTYRHVRNRHNVRPRRYSVENEGDEGCTKLEEGIFSMDDMPELRKMSSLTQHSSQATPRSSYSRTLATGSPQSRLLTNSHTSLLDNFDGLPTPITPHMQAVYLSTSPSALRLSPDLELNPDLEALTDNSRPLLFPESDSATFIPNSLLRTLDPITQQKADRNAEVALREVEESDPAERDIVERQAIEQDHHPNAEKRGVPESHWANDEANMQRGLNPAIKAAFSVSVMGQRREGEIPLLDLGAPESCSAYKATDVAGIYEGAVVGGEGSNSSASVQWRAKLEDPFVVEEDGKSGNSLPHRVAAVMEKMNSDEIDLDGDDDGDEK